ncbi:MAG: ABC transporter permease [Candidatus Saccharibacteria bacterium]
MEALLQFVAAEKTEVLQIVGLSVFVSGSATILGTLVGIPLGAWLGMTRLPVKRFLLQLTYTLMALPPVLAGLFIYLILSRSGPLGILELLFTPAAMIVAQFVLVTPIITGLSAAAVAAKEKTIYDQARGLGASNWQAVRTVVSESRTGIVAAIMTGFGRAFAEVGAVMMVGGNIKGYTRVLTTTIMMETRQGNFDLAISLGIILLVISFIISRIVLRSNQELFNA